ncbi:MAG TPA: Nif3-like dinuclear metal center hexameric protein [Candidatus Lokiarchaeia archaeon]|nr:Nif3-like dinuclear metal center hexameric protein [Candidatus Lokiarchaeia archaeon]
MKAIELLDHFQKIGTWVNWNGKEADKFLFGDPDTEVKAIGVAWMPSLANLKQAEEMGCNVFITHEPLYAGFANEYGVYSANNVLLEEDDPWIEKGKWLEEQNMVVLRCHDTWDDYPGIGIHGAWAKFLGFEEKPVNHAKFYEVHEILPTSLDDFGRRILKRVRTLGQDAVLVVGDSGKEVTRVALGTGAITNYRTMHDLGGDVLLLTDDGTRLWESAQWSEDVGIPLIIVNHATSEEPGIRELARYLQSTFLHVPVYAIERGCLYHSIVR